MSGYSMLSDLLMIDDLWMSHTEILLPTLIIHIHVL